MEFKFPVNELLKGTIVEINQSMLPPGFSGDRRALWDTVGKISEVVNAMGEASAAAQGLTKPITTAERLRNSEHTIYLLVDQNAGHGRGAVTGMLKTGKKGLYVFDRNGHHYQVSPPCVLDFYVHESRQRNGLGKRLFEHMLQKEEVQPVKMAIDRPSEKFLGFLNKHYNLSSPVKQMNNYVVFDGFFPTTPEKNGAVENNNSGITPGKKLSANGLQSGAFATPMGRYGAPRPHCSMGQIIHNQTSTIPKSTEPTGSTPDTRYQRAPGHSPANPANTTQSAPNMYYNSSQQQRDDQQQQQSQYMVKKQNTNLGEATHYPVGDQYSQQQIYQQPHNSQSYYPQVYEQQNYQPVMSQVAQPANVNVGATGSNQANQQLTEQYPDQNGACPARDSNNQGKYLGETDGQLGGMAHNQNQQPIMEALHNVPERHVQTPGIMGQKQFQNAQLGKYPQYSATEMYSRQVSQSEIPQSQSLVQAESRILHPSHNALDGSQVVQSGGHQPRTYQPQVHQSLGPQPEIQHAPQSGMQVPAGQDAQTHQYSEQLETMAHGPPSQPQSFNQMQPQQMALGGIPNQQLYNATPTQPQPEDQNRLQHFPQNIQNVRYPQESSSNHQSFTEMQNQHLGSQNMNRPQSTTANLNLASGGPQNFSLHNTPSTPNPQFYSSQDANSANSSISQPNMPMGQYEVTSAQIASQPNVNRQEDTRLPGFLPLSDQISSEGPKPVVKNNPSQSDSSVVGYQTSGEKNYETSDHRARGDTRVVEEKINSSPKLERPRSLSIQLSEEQMEDTKNNDVESQVPVPEKIDDIEEEIAKLAVSESNAVIEPNGKSPGKKTPSHLTEQGFFDLKFYHNKLW